MAIRALYKRENVRNWVQYRRRILTTSHLFELLCIYCRRR